MKKDELNVLINSFKDKAQTYRNNQEYEIDSNNEDEQFFQEFPDVLNLKAMILSKLKQEYGMMDASFSLMKKHYLK